MRRYKTLTCLFLIIAVLAVFWQVSNYEFIVYDDTNYVTENPYVKAGLTRESIIWAFTTNYFSYWHPLTWLSHMLDVELHGLNPEWHHLMNVFLHIGNTVLLFLLLNRITGAFWQSSFVAALFALHPLHVESVAWVSERKDVLSALFWIITLTAYAWYVERPGRARYLLVVFAFITALMSKPMVVTLPFVLFLMDYWPLRRVSFARQGPQISQIHQQTDHKALYFRLILEKIPFIALSAAMGFFTIYAQQKNEALSSLGTLPLMFRALNALSAYLGYIIKMVWPQNLSIIYPLPLTAPVFKGLLSGLMVIVISVLIVRTARRHPYLLRDGFGIY